MALKDFTVSKITSFRYSQVGQPTTPPTPQNFTTWDGTEIDGDQTPITNRLTTGVDEDVYLHPNATDKDPGADSPLLTWEG